ncbi:MAG: glycosyltransferase family 2 protein [Myxococcota bacterium]|nr:glycosyltransferase family 2 protein [Myxococcota bacterium]
MKGVASHSESAQPTNSHGRYGVAIVHYGDYAELAGCLASVSAQVRASAGVWVLDVDGDGAQRAALKGDYPEIRFLTAPNRGYASGANRLLAAIGEGERSVDFVLLLNSDITLEPNFADALVEALGAHPDAALATGKLLRRDGLTLDSAGIDLPLNRRPRDRGSETLDRGQFDRGEYVFGASGAAMLLRCSALPELAIEGEIFDEDFFLYYEDTDLCWRSQVLGWRVYYEPAARALHTRGWQKGTRSTVPAWVRRHSFKNYYLQRIKNESIAQFLVGLPVFLVWEIFRLAYALFRDRALLRAYPMAFRSARRAFAKRRLLRGGSVRGKPSSPLG